MGLDVVRGGGRPRPRHSPDDPALPTPPRPLPSQLDQSCWSLSCFVGGSAGGNRLTCSVEWAGRFSTQNVRAPRNSMPKVRPVAADPARNLKFPMKMEAQAGVRAQFLRGLTLSYRGCGGSSGHPTEKGLIEDAKAAYAFSVARYPAGRLVLWANRSASRSRSRWQSKTRSGVSCWKLLLLRPSTSPHSTTGSCRRGCS
jgi:hypothetical protein